MDHQVTLDTLATAPDGHDPWRGGVASGSAAVLRLYLGALPAGAQARAHGAPFAQPTSPHLPPPAHRERLRAGMTQRLEFVTEPLVRATPLAGFLGGELAFACNRLEFDFSVTLSELTPRGEYLEFCGYRARACQTLDRAGQATRAARHLGFQSGRRLERLLPAGSRIVMLLGAGEPDHVLDSVKSAREPLQIRWHDDSFVEVPLDERRITR
jgi:hypothetical protein